MATFTVSFKTENEMKSIKTFHLRLLTDFIAHTANLIQCHFEKVHAGSVQLCSKMCRSMGFDPSSGANSHEVISKCGTIKCKCLKESEILLGWKCISFIKLKLFDKLENEIQGYVDMLAPHEADNDTILAYKEVMFWCKLLHIRHVEREVGKELEFLNRISIEYADISNQIVYMLKCCLLCLAGKGEATLHDIMNKFKICKRDDTYCIRLYIIYCLHAIYWNGYYTYGTKSFKGHKMKTSGILWSTLCTFTETVFSKYKEEMASHCLCLNTGDCLLMGDHIDESIRIVCLVLDAEPDSINVRQDIMDGIIMLFGEAAMRNNTSKSTRNLQRAFNLLNGVEKNKTMALKIQIKIATILYTKKEESDVVGQYCESKISDTEATIAGKLRACCDENGKEFPEKLYDSATALMELGTFYKQQSQTQDNVQQKLSIIRSAALLMAAKIRFERFNIDTENILQSINDCLTEVGALAISCATLAAVNPQTISPVNISKFSGELFIKYVVPLRRRTTTEFKSFGKISTTCTGNDKWQQEENKIKEVRGAMEKITRDFITIMEEIANKCTTILGVAPCRFTLVGLGSLARQEITPYSDFEHVIVLEEGVQGREDYSILLEYFRWFSVIFQLIIINFGETFIRSVGVPSLNDLNNPDKSKNWFYDNVTPVGIAFDGMVRHASMNPLGAIGPTVHKHHVMELIKPVSEMIKYLSSGEHLKNGYYVREIIARTCYVYGDAKVYKEFNNEKSIFLSIIEKKAITETIDNKGEMVSIRLDMLADHKALLQENVNDTVNTGGIPISNLEPSISVASIKRDFYRPIVTYVATLAKMHGVFIPSSFKAIEELEKNSFITERAAHYFKYAVALVCELRINAYNKSHNERGDTITMQTLLQQWGKTSCLDYFNIVHAIHYISKDVQWAKYYDGDINKVGSLDIFWLQYFGFGEEAAEKGEELISQYVGDTDYCDKKFYDSFKYLFLILFTVYDKRFLSSNEKDVKALICSMKHLIGAIHVRELGIVHDWPISDVQISPLTLYAIPFRVIDKINSFATQQDKKQLCIWCDKFITERADTKVTKFLVEYLKSYTQDSANIPVINVSEVCLPDVFGNNLKIQKSVYYIFINFIEAEKYAAATEIWEKSVFYFDVVKAHSTNYMVPSDHDSSFSVTINFLAYLNYLIEDGCSNPIVAMLLAVLIHDCTSYLNREISLVKRESAQPILSEELSKVHAVKCPSSVGHRFSIQDLTDSFASYINILLQNRAFHRLEEICEVIPIFILQNEKIRSQIANLLDNKLWQSYFETAEEIKYNLFQEKYNSKYICGLVRVYQSRSEYNAIKQCTLLAISTKSEEAMYALLQTNLSSRKLTMKNPSIIDGLLDSLTMTLCQRGKYGQALSVINDVKRSTNNESSSNNSLQLVCCCIAEQTELFEILNDVAFHCLLRGEILELVMCVWKMMNLANSSRKYFDLFLYCCFIILC